MMQTYTTIEYSVQKGIALVTLNRPDKLNAFNGTMQLELLSALDESDHDDSVRAVVFTGAGRAFCAGMDLSKGDQAFGSGREGAHAIRVNDVLRDGGGVLTLRLFNSLKPTIAAVNGAAVGIGATMQLPMDFRLASSSARFGFVFARRGISPDGASTWFLPRVVGLPRALDWMLRGRMIAADEALSAGLIMAVHEPDTLLEAAFAIAREVAESAPVSVAMTRQMLWRLASSDHPMEAHKVESRMIQSRGQSADVREGVSSFLEKRPADFPDSVSSALPESFPWWREPEFE